MPTVVYTEVMGGNVLLGFSDGTSEFISVDLIEAIMADPLGDLGPVGCQEPFDVLERWAVEKEKEPQAHCAKIC